MNKKLDVSKLVKKYREDYPFLDRSLLRKLIRLENKIENPSELRKLDRYLAKAFQKEVSLPISIESEKPSTETRIPVPEGILEFWEDADWLGETFPGLKPLKDLADIQRELRKKYVGV